CRLPDRNRIREARDVFGEWTRSGSRNDERLASVELAADLGAGPAGTEQLRPDEAHHQPAGLFAQRVLPRLLPLDRVTGALPVAEQPAVLDHAIELTEHTMVGPCKVGH